MVACHSALLGFLSYQVRDRCAQEPSRHRCWCLGDEPDQPVRKRTRSSALALDRFQLGARRRLFAVGKMEDSDVIDLDSDRRQSPYSDRARRSSRQPHERAPGTL